MPKRPPTAEHSPTKTPLFQSEPDDDTEEISVKYSSLSGSYGSSEGQEAPDLDRRSIRTSLCGVQVRASRSVTRNSVEECQELHGNEEAYEQVVAQGRECVGYGGMANAFPEEWSAQLLILCQETFRGDQLVLFCPAFLSTIVDDDAELERAFKYIMLVMDEVVMNTPGSYVFVYCFLGAMDWNRPSLMKYLRLAYDILPHKYVKKLRTFYVLHPTTWFRCTMWTLWAMVSKRFWEKVTYVETLTELLNSLQPADEEMRIALRRRFPLAVHRQDCVLRGDPPPTLFGQPLEQTSGRFGVDFIDRTTGKVYPRLPSAVVFLCETMERQASDNEFEAMFSVPPEEVAALVDILNQGKPLERETSSASMWCALHLFLRCLPLPLLSHEAFDDLFSRGIEVEDKKAQFSFLVELITQRLPPEAAYLALYVTSFMCTMCKNAATRLEKIKNSRTATVTFADEDEADFFDGTAALTAAVVARTFAPCFLHPKAWPSESAAFARGQRVAEALLETFVQNAEDPELWIGAPPEKDDDDECDPQRRVGDDDGFELPGDLGQ